MIKKEAQLEEMPFDGTLAMTKEYINTMGFGKGQRDQQTKAGGTNSGRENRRGIEREPREGNM